MQSICVQRIYAYMLLVFRCFSFCPVLSAVFTFFRHHLESRLTIPWQLKRNCIAYVDRHAAPKCTKKKHITNPYLHIAIHWNGWFNLVFSLESEWYFNYVLCHTKNAFEYFALFNRVKLIILRIQKKKSHHIHMLYYCSIMDYINDLQLRNNKCNCYSLHLCRVCVCVWVCAAIDCGQ